MIGKPGDGFRIAMSVLDVFRSTVGAAALGFARRALDESVKRATERKLFGAPMAELQMVQGHIADMALDVDAAALLVYRAAWTKDMGAARVTREAAMAKLFATERAQERDRQGRAAAWRRRRAPRPYRREPLPRNPRAAHLRGRVGRAEGGDRQAGHWGGLMMLGPIGAYRHVRPRQSAAAGSSGRTSCSTASTIRSTSTPRVELTDRMVEKGFGDHTALIGNGRRRTYKELADWTNRLAHALVENYGVKPGNRVLIRSANNPAMVACWLAATKAGAVVVNTMPMLRAGELEQDRRQGRDRARALRHAADGRAGRLRQGQPLPEDR